MKGGVSIVLIILLLFPQFLQGFLIVDYQLRMDEIEAKYCKNLDKPELECHGSCHLEDNLTIATSSSSPEEDSPQLLIVRVSEYLAEESFDFDSMVIGEYESSLSLMRTDLPYSADLQIPTPPPQF